MFDSPEDQLEALKQRLLTSPDSVYFTVYLDEDNVYGYVLAYMIKSDVVRLYQTWFDQKMELKTKRLILMRLILWAEQNGVSQIRGESGVNDTEVMGQCGLSVIANVYTVDVGKQIEDLISKES